MTTTSGRAAAYRLTQPSAPPVMRTWHAVHILDGAHHGAGRRGFLTGVCEHHTGRVQVWLVGGGPSVCCLPVPLLAAVTTLHGGRSCPANACTEGDPINVETP